MVLPAGSGFGIFLGNVPGIINNVPDAGKGMATANAVSILGGIVVFRNSI
jgi:hypothetical protein